MTALVQVGLGDVILSELCDPQSAYATNRFIEIYNTGSSSVDLSGWKVVAIGNGSEIFTWNLSGSISSGDALVCGDDGNTLITCDFEETDWSSSNSSWNGKSGDGAKLLDGSTVIDEASSHGNFENKSSARNSSIESAVTTFDSGEWTSTSTTNYESASPGSHTSDYPAVAVNAPTSFSIADVTSDKISLTWTAPSGTYDNVLVFGRSGSAVDHSPSGAGSGYNNANAAWGSAGDHDNSKLLYSGTGTSLTVTGLSDGTTYHFKAYAYDDSNWSTGTGGVNDVAEVQEVSSLAASIDDTQSEVTWTNYTGSVTTWWDQVIVLAKSGSAVDGAPSGAPSAYTANATFGSGTEIGTGNYVVYKGTGTSVIVTGLTNGTAYHYEAFVYYEDASSGHDYSDGTTASATANESIHNKVIINEIDMNGDPGYEQEAIELLVVDGPVDMRGWILTEESESNDITFASNALWSSVASGTYITIYVHNGSGITEDTDDSDKNLTVKPDGGGYISGTSALATTELFYLSSGALSSSTAVDAVNCGETVSNAYGLTIPDVGSGFSGYFSDAANFNNDDASDWSSYGSRSFGSANSGQNDSSLPVELTSFKAVSRGGKVHLTWVTESETDNLGFIVYKSIEDGKAEEQASYRSDRRLQGQGSTTQRTVYELADEAVRPGVRYVYQLADVDISGTITRHRAQTVIVRAAGLQVQPAWPNPFNPVTNFTVTTDAKSHLDITVFDVCGRRVKTLAHRPISAGDYHLTWDGTDRHGQAACSGIYFLRITSRNHRSIQKIILVR